MIKVIALVLTLASVAQPTRSPLRAVVATGEYFGETYIQKGPAASFVYTVGEPISLKITIANEHPAPHRFRATTAEQMFTVAASRDEQTVDVRLTFDEGRLSGPLLDRDGAIERRQYDQAVWRAEVSSPLNPGVYAVRIGSSAVDEAGRAIVMTYGTYRFEVRPRTAEGRAEALVREGLRSVMPLRGKRPDGRCRRRAARNARRAVQRPGRGLSDLNGEVLRSVGLQLSFRRGEGRRIQRTLATPTGQRGSRLRVGDRRRGDDRARSTCVRTLSLSGSATSNRS
jgi:hypothetical protein